MVCLLPQVACMFPRAVHERLHVHAQAHNAQWDIFMVHVDILTSSYCEVPVHHS